MDLNKTKSKKSELAIKDFEKIQTYAETIECRHAMFSKYFNDSKPKCKEMCDVCRDRKQAEKSLDMYKKLSLNHYSAPVMDGDSSDLYGGKQIRYINHSRKVKDFNLFMAFKVGEKVCGVKKANMVKQVQVFPVKEMLVTLPQT